MFAQEKTLFYLALFNTNLNLFTLSEKNSIFFLISTRVIFINRENERKKNLYCEITTCEGLVLI